MSRPASRSRRPIRRPRRGRSGPGVRCSAAVDHRPDHVRTVPRASRRDPATRLMTDVIRRSVMFSRPPVTAVPAVGADRARDCRRQDETALIDHVRCGRARAARAATAISRPSAGWTSTVRPGRRCSRSWARTVPARRQRWTCWRASGAPSTERRPVLGMRPGHPVPACGPASGIAAAGRWLRRRAHRRRDRRAVAALPAQAGRIRPERPSRVELDATGGTWPSASSPAVSGAASTWPSPCAGPPRAADPRRADHRARPRVPAPHVGRDPRAATEAGRTVLLTTHYLEEAEALADRLAIMDGGGRGPRHALRDRRGRRPGSPCTLPADAPPPATRRFPRRRGRAVDRADP